MSLFILFPFAAVVFAALFYMGYLTRRKKWILTTSVLWLVYGIYETLIYVRILCSGECNIRIDLLLIYPLLALFSIVSIVIYFRDRT